jgi:hypothetical protein
MGFPRRPRPTPKQAASSSSDSTIQSGSSSLPASKRLRLDNPLVFNSEHIKVFLVTAKLAPDEVSELTRSIESNGGKCVSRAEEATIIVSNTKVWNRLKKYLPERGYVGQNAASTPDCALMTVGLSGKQEVCDSRMAARQCSNRNTATLRRQVLYPDSISP